MSKVGAEQLRPSMPRPYQYCPCCGTPFTRQGLHGRERLVCPACQFIFWQNPVVGVAVVVMQDACIVLARRARGVYKGAWCIPCGYVEYDEDVREAAQREFQEETGLLVEVGEIYAVHSNFHAFGRHLVSWHCAQRHLAAGRRCGPGGVCIAAALAGQCGVSYRSSGVGAITTGVFFLIERRSLGQNSLAHLGRRISPPGGRPLAARGFTAPATRRRTRRSGCHGPTRTQQ